MVARMADFKSKRTSAGSANSKPEKLTRLKAEWEKTLYRTINLAIEIAKLISPLQERHQD